MKAVSLAVIAVAENQHRLTLSSGDFTHLKLLYKHIRTYITEFVTVSWRKQAATTTSLVVTVLLLAQCFHCNYLLSTAWNSVPRLRELTWQQIRFAPSCTTCHVAAHSRSTALLFTAQWAEALIRRFGPSLLAAYSLFWTAPLALHDSTGTHPPYLRYITPKL